MYRNKKELKIDREHERLIALYLNSPISERKKKTALYKYTKDTAFANQAIDTGINPDKSRITYRHIKAEHLKNLSLMNMTSWCSAINTEVL